MNTHGKRRYNVLSAAFVSKATEAGHYHDGHGLILRVTRAGSKQWVQRLRIRGKRRELGLGGYPLVTLAMAREAALAHTLKDKAEAAYARSDLFEKRRELMTAWARYLNPAPAGVVSLDTRRAG